MTLQGLNHPPPQKFCDLHRVVAVCRREQRAVVGGLKLLVLKLLVLQLLVLLLVAVSLLVLLLFLVLVLVLMLLMLPLLLMLLVLLLMMWWFGYHFASLRNLFLRGRLEKNVHAPPCRRFAELESKQGGTEEHQNALTRVLGALFFAAQRLLHKRTGGS